MCHETGTGITAVGRLTVNVVFPRVTRENSLQGICGFVSAICFQMEHNESMTIPSWLTRSQSYPDLSRAKDINSFDTQSTDDLSVFKFFFRAKSSSTLGIEQDRVKWFKKEISDFLLNCKQDMLSKIEEFTKTFDGYNTFRMSNYIKTLETKSDYSLGMPIEAVQEYLRQKKINTKIETINRGDPILGSSIVALYDGKGDLKHYVYVDENKKIWSWGECFETFNSAEFNGLIKKKQICIRQRP